MTKIRLLAAVVAVLACVSCSKNKHNLIPSELAGFWTTDATRYQGRFLELYQAFVIVGEGPEHPPSVQMVDKVTTHSEQNDLALTIYSSDLEGGHYELTLQFSPANRGEIRFPHQKEVWKRYSETEGKVSKSR